MRQRGKPAFGLNQLEKRLKRTDLTEKERMETEERLGNVRIG